jgi:hypothetical protein
MATDQKLRRQYFDEVNTEVSKLEDIELFHDLVNKNVN